MGALSGSQEVEAQFDAARLEFMSRHATPIYFDDWVYFIRNPHVNRIKIGYTGNNPEIRLRTIEDTAGHEMERIGLIRGYREMERFLHRQFAAYCWRSEWFADNDWLRALITAHAMPWTTAEDIPNPRTIETTDFGLTEIYWPKFEAIRLWFDSNLQPPEPPQ